MCCVVMGCGLVSCVVVWCHVLCVTGLAVWLGEWWLGCLFDLACCYVGLFGKLGCLMGVLVVCAMLCGARMLWCVVWCFVA